MRRLSVLVTLATLVAVTAAADAAQNHAAVVRAQTAVEMGHQAAVAAGPKVKLPKKTVGILNVAGTSEGSQRAEKATKAALRAIGWSYKRCDAEGTLTKMASCASTLINQRVDMVFSIAVESAAINPQLKLAKSRKIPWVNIGGAVLPSPLFTANYAPDDVAMAKILDAYMLKQLSLRGSGSKEIATHTFPQIYALKLRSDQLKRDIAGKNVKIVADHTTDFANPIEDVRRATTDMLTTHPDIDVFWGATDFNLPPVAQVLSSRFGGKNYPDRPLVVSFYADLVNIDALRKKTADAVVDSSLEANGWVAVDQAAEYFARKRPFGKNAFASGYKVKFNTPLLVTQKNAPAANTYPKYKVDAAKFFRAKFSKEFTRN